MNIRNHATPTKSQRVTATVLAALICLVIILAMFAAPADTGSHALFPRGSQTQTVGGDVGFRFTAENILGLYVIGLISGTFGGMLGMGGGVFKMSFLLLFFSFHPGVSKFAALLAYFVVAVGATYRYVKLKYVMLEVVKILIPSSVVGIVLGAMIGHHLPRDMLTLLLGMFLLFIAVVMVKRVLSHYQDVAQRRGGSAQDGDRAAGSSRGRPAPTPATWKLVVCGFPGGLLSAMLGISGGVVTNPLQQVLANIPIRNAIANTLAKASVTIPIACVMIMTMGVQAGQFDPSSPILVALCLTPGSVIGSQLGPALMRRMSPVAVHSLFGAVAFFLGITMLFFGH
jgi:hypothetical protein